MPAARKVAIARGRVGKVTRESQTKKAMEKYERKMRLMSRYADDPQHLNLILSHGEYQGNALNTFRVHEGQIIVFVSKTAVYLPQKIIDKDFYDIFGDAQNVSNLLKRRMGRVPWYLKGFEKRTYAPGDQCPNLTLHMFDPAWGGMGLHALPLTKGQRLEGPDARPGQFHGQTVKLKDLTGRGVLFVVACRAVVGREQSPTFFHAENYTLQTGPHLPNERILQRFDRRANIGSTLEFRRGVRQLREAIRMGDERVPMNVDGMSPRRRAAMASVIRQGASALRKRRAAEKKAARRKKRVAEKKAARR
jgi:hypothetical protein